VRRVAGEAGTVHEVHPLSLPRAANPRESPLVTAVLDLAALHPHLIRLSRHPAGEWTAGVWRDGEFVPTGRVHGAPIGWSDVSGFVPKGMPKRSGCHIAGEAKRDQYALATPEQIDHLTAVVEAGGIGILFWDVVQFWAEYLDAVGMCERGGLIVPVRKRAVRS